MVLSSPKQISRIDIEPQTDSFDHLFRRYYQLVKEKYWSDQPDKQTIDQAMYADLPLGCDNHTFPIWVVDDNPDVPILMRMVFNRVAPTITPTFFSDGDELLINLKIAPILPRVILLDLFMKRVNGFDSLHQIRTHPIYQHLPIVMLTSSFNEGDRKKALALGADDFLVKPLVFDHTVSMMSRLIEKWS